MWVEIDQVIFERRVHMTKQYVSLLYFGSESTMSLQIENHATQKSTVLDHFLEETLKVTMKNKFESSSEIFKGNFKET